MVVYGVLRPTAGEKYCADGKNIHR